VLGVASARANPWVCPWSRRSLAAALADHLAAYGQPGPDGLVFTSVGGWAAAAQQLQPAGLAPSHPSGRPGGASLPRPRHTSATLSIAAGASTRELMARLGHSSSAAALRYQHVMAGRDAAIAAALDELIEAASALAESPPSASSGTRVARIGRAGSGKQRH
jgi:integrase